LRLTVHGRHTSCIGEPLPLPLVVNPTSLLLPVQDLLPDIFVVSTELKHISWPFAIPVMGSGLLGVPHWEVKKDCGKQFAPVESHI
jgi:hypothetical protein